MSSEIAIAVILLLNYGYVESGTNPLTIAGGSDTNISIHKFMVAILIQSHQNVAWHTHRCVGSIISPTLVITPTHCVHYRTANQILVHVGSSNPQTLGRYENIAEIFQHRNYNSYGRINDISLLLLKNKLTYNECMGPINLPEVEEMTYATKTLIKAIGFGETGGASFTRTLQEADLLISSYDECKELFRIELVSQFCAESVNITLGDLDEGSPVLYENQLIGIVLASKIADNNLRRSVILLVRIPDYLGYIEHIMREHP